jgi:hypothetical protein
MPHLPETTDPADWHRYFAIEANNRAWDLTVIERSTEEDAEMLHAAHAAALHWDAVGTELNHMRALMLLAEAHALLGMGRTAFAYAKEMREYFLQADPPDWELAFVHAIHAHAAQVVGAAKAYEDSYDAAKKAIDGIASDVERAIVMKTFRQIAPPE